MATPNQLDFLHVKGNSYPTLPGCGKKLPYELDFYSSAWCGKTYHDPRQLLAFSSPSLVKKVEEKDWGLFIVNGYPFVSELLLCETCKLNVSASLGLVKMQIDDSYTDPMESPDEYTEKDEWYDEHCEEESPLPVPRNPAMFRRTKRADSNDATGIGEWLAKQNARFDN